MDLSKYKKPIHITCPKCRYEYELNGGQIMAEKNILKDEFLTLKAKLQHHRNTCGRDKKYKEMLKDLKTVEVKYIRAKQMAQLASEQSEIHKYILFKQMCAEKLGNDVVIKMLKECEDELSYRTADLAKQRFNNFKSATDQ